MGMSNLREVAGQIKQAQAELQRLAKDNGGAAVAEAFAECFEGTKLRSIVWEQYTPYFNDGDVCTFRVHDPIIFAEDEDEEDEDECGGTDPSWPRDEQDRYMGNGWAATERERLTEKFGPGVVQKVSEIWREINDRTVLEAMFGDHVKVTVTRDGVSVDDYEHE